MAISKTRFSKDFERIWNKYLDVNSTKIIMVGKKSPNMNAVPVYELYGAFSGWNEKNLDKQELIDYNSMLKIKISDLEELYSQPNVLDGSGKIIVEQTNNLMYKNGNNFLFQDLTLGKLYTLKIKYKLDSKNNSSKKITLYNENHKIYGNYILNKYGENVLEVKFSNAGKNLFLQCDDGNDNCEIIITESQIGISDGSIKSPITNLKSSIDYITVENRTFKVNSQKLSASNTLMILELVNTI